MDEDHRPLGGETGRMPPDPTKAKANEAEQIGHFVQEFKDLMLQGQFINYQIGSEGKAALAQLGERQTEDLKAPCSIHGGGISFFECFTDIF